MKRYDLASIGSSADPGMVQNVNGGYIKFEDYSSAHDRIKASTRAQVESAEQATREREKEADLYLRIIYEFDERLGKALKEHRAAHNPVEVEPTGFA